MIVDLRSDTVTRPTAAMKIAMMEAKVGDDVLGDDPTVKELEAKAATLFGHEAALFCPSGTMTNQIAIKVHTNAPGEVICDELAHIYRYEGGGIGFNSACSVRLIKGAQGRFSAEQLKAEINPEDIHLAPSQLVSLENTCNKGGGTCWDFEEIRSIAKVCSENNLPLHLDGARLFNALVAQKIESKEMGKQFSSISICLSKGLGAPVGSLLIGSASFIKKSVRIRKILGGGMRQAGVLAAAGIYALDKHVNRLEEDHQRAKEIANALKSKSYVQSIYPVETNIVIFKLKEDYPSEQFISEMKSKGILVAGMGPQIIRMVTHLDVDDQGMEYLLENL
tara:strand:+ start:5457 stop:6464 length:1008 start_codon:yes stop_codon:yes gene_type:complete